jgi:hypothetical protein
MKDLGPLHQFLGVSVQHQADGLFLTWCQFALDILEHAGMVDWNRSRRLWTRRPRSPPLIGPLLLIRLSSRATPGPSST